MGLNIPTTAAQAAINLSNLESKLNQTSPLADEAFQRVLSGMEGLAFTTLYKFGVERALQNLALTATKEDLDRLGIEVGIIRKVAESAQLEIELPGTNGTIIPINWDFVGDSNGVRYYSDAQATISGGVAVIDVTASESGVVGNLLVSNTLSIGTQIAGAENQAAVTAVNTIGAEEETDDAYRLRILNALRTTLGGGNSEDHKAWSEEVAGVFRAFPYSGKDTGTSYPADRTVFIEADSTIDPDGIAPAALLDSVRDSINTDPVTGKSRPPLGLTDSTLFIQSITRLVFYVEITGLVVDSAILAQVKTDIASALDIYFRSTAPFVVGIDFEPDRNDIITSPTISAVVQDVVVANNGSFERARFGLAVGTYIDKYTLTFDKLVKNGTVTYV